jgi:hypothetical protein
MSPVNGPPQDCLFGWRYCGITRPVQGHCGVFQSCVGAVGFVHTQLVALVWLLQKTVQCILVAHKNHEKHYTGKSQQLALYLVWKYAAQISVLVIHVNPRRGFNFFTCIPIKDQTSWLKLSPADLIAGTTLKPLRKTNWTRHQLFL